MVDEEKVKLMVKLALFEQKEIKEDLSVNKYYRSDYISINIIKTLITSTIAYLILVLLYVLYRIDNIVEEITTMDFMKVGRDFLLVYLIILVTTLVVTYILSSKKYAKVKESLVEYDTMLKELHLYQKKIKKNQAKVEAGGLKNDDESFSY